MQIIQPLTKEGDLNQKIKRTCEAYVAGEGTFAQCLVEAGKYAKGTATNSARSLLEVPEVKAYIAELEAKCQLITIAKKDDILMFWTHMMMDSEQKGSDRIAASKLLAQHFGMMEKVGDTAKEKDPFIIDIMPKKLLPKVMEVVDER